jgi:hypothetical protein
MTPKTVTDRRALLAELDRVRGRGRQTHVVDFPRRPPFVLKRPRDEPVSSRPDAG